MLKVRDRWFRILVVLTPFLLICYTNGLPDSLSDHRLRRLIVSLCSIIAVTEGSRYLIYTSKTWTGIAGRFRIWLVILLGIAYTSIIMAISAVLRNYFLHGTWNPAIEIDANIMINDRKLIIGLFGYAVMNALFNFGFLLIAFEVLYHYQKLRNTEIDKARLEKEKMYAELQQLKGIVNPHFLFNNLNSLSSLISEDPVKAEAFLDELTKVFRYLLRNNETMLVSLDQEKEFIRSYYHLLQSRYGRGIELEIRLLPGQEEMYLPPLTLQLLVENAVKHNRLSKDQPLMILIEGLPGNELRVTNNVLKKEGTVESTGIGLQHINTRYQMLQMPGIRVENEQDQFTVTLLLVPKAIAEAGMG